MGENDKGKLIMLNRKINIERDPQIGNGDKLKEMLGKLGCEIHSFGTQIVTEEEFEKGELPGCPCVRCRIERNEDLPPRVLAKYITEMMDSVEYYKMGLKAMFDSDNIPGHIKTGLYPVFAGYASLDAHIDSFRQLTKTEVKKTLKDKNSKIFRMFTEKDKH